MASYNAVFYDKLKTESDQKDLLIAQLKAEIFELKQNERDQALLRQQIANLEARNQTINEDKIRREHEWASKSDLQQSSVNNLRDDLAGLRGQLADSQLQSLNDLLDSRDRECQDQKRLINEDSSAIALLRGDLLNAQDLNAKLRDQVSLANADVDRLQVQNTRLQSDQRDHLDKLSLERADKDMLNRRIVELIDSNEAARLDARRKDDELVVKERLANDAASQLLALHGELQDAKVRADRHREDVATLSKLTEEERLRAIRAQQRAEEAEREKRDRELQAEYLRREADNARLEKSRILDEKLGQDEELFALRDHVEVVHDRNREYARELDRFAEQDEQLRSALDRRNRVSYLKSKNEEELGRSIRKVEVARSRSGSPAKRSPGRRY